MSSSQWTVDDEVRLADYLVDQVCDGARGRLDDECLANQPRDRYFIGSLRPRDDHEELRAISNELLAKLAPTAIGADLRVRPSGESFYLQVDLEWACYYRVLPTYQQQLEHQRRVGASAVAEATAPAEAVAGDDGTEESATALGEDAPDSDVDIDDEATATPTPPPPQNVSSRRRRPSDSLYVIFEKIVCRAQASVGFQRTGEGQWEPSVAALEAAIMAEMGRAQGVALSDGGRLRASGPASEPVRVPETALASSATYATFLGSLNRDVEPVWKLDVTAAVITASDPLDVDISVQFINTSPRLLNPRGRESLNTETYLFDVRAGLEMAGAEARPFHILLAPRGFRYDRELWGRGFNSDVVQEGPTAFRTEAAPVYRQARYVTRQEPAATYEELSTDPVPLLGRIATAMREYLATWDTAEEAYRRSPHWSEFAEEFSSDRGRFEGELGRFERGVELIQGSPDINLAFRLTNETFRRGANREWRLFQLVFLVSQLPGMSALAGGRDAPDREFVDIVFFPTGGGKTEAYLATLVFSCFFDRLRGKSAGVTAWIRFPLRLLTLQQTQRITAAIATAELVRRQTSNPLLADPRLANSDPFAVGYFVGQDGSPNEIADPATMRYGASRFAAAWSQALDDRARQKWKRIAKCPACNTLTVHVDFDRDTARLSHLCTNPGCAFPGGVLPIYVVDNEIYRYLPTVMVGTIDKLAGLGNQRKMSMVFGRVDGQCSVHGYYFRNCTQSGCTDRTRLRPGRPPGLSGPSLFVQDELHLLREGLGTFDGHYETFAQELSRLFGNPTIKVIASSATIEAFGRQVEHLYGRSSAIARVFPGPGPRLSESFYARTLGHPQRLFVGVLPHNKTISNAMLELLELYHRVVAKLRELPAGAPSPFGCSMAPGTTGWDLLLDSYVTSLTYFRSKRELDSVGFDIESDLNPNLVADGLQPVELLTLEGGIGTDEVERTLAHLERVRPPAERHPDAVLATNMVSHGVDVDRLNMMLFDGMPSLTAEYIQASSRVGRRHCGVVFVGLHPARERDQSHYRYFRKYHQFQGQLVEPVAINRWAKFAIDRTLPGLFMAVVLQVLATSGPGNPGVFYQVDTLKRKIAAGDITADSFAPMLEQAYFGASSPETLADMQRRVRRLLDQIIDSPGSVSMASDALIPKPMTSLRDVDEQLEIELDSLGQNWTAIS
jgi:hypothetical protein